MLTKHCYSLEWPEDTSEKVSVTREKRLLTAKSTKNLMFSSVATELKLLRFWF